MRAIRCLAMVVGLLGVPGCIPMFLHAGYTANEVVVDHRLVGTWIDPVAGGITRRDTIAFRLEGRDGYRVTYLQRGDDPDSLVFLGHLFRVGELMLVDLEPHPANQVSAFYLPAHSFWRVAFVGDTLVRGGLDQEWVVAAARRGGQSCPADTVGAGGSDDVVFTCRTPAVRRLLAEAAADPGAFTTDEPLVRMGAGAKR